MKNTINVDVDRIVRKIRAEVDRIPRRNYLITSPLVMYRVVRAFVDDNFERLRRL